MPERKTPKTESRAAPATRSRGLLPDTLEELNATVEELRVAEEEMRAQNEELLRTRLLVEAERHRYQDLFESAPDGYLVTDLDGRVLEANHAASELLGIAPRFLKGRGLGTSVAPEDLTAYSAALNSLIESPAAPPPQEWALRLRRRNAGPFHAAVTVARVVPQDRQPATLRWLIRDVSARREAEATRRAASDRERRTAETLQRLLLPALPAAGFAGLTVEAFTQAADDGAENGAEIGGGFFDAFALGDDAVALAVGVVAGGGLAAATRSAEVRYALRLLLRESGRPAPALARLNEAAWAALCLGDAGGDRPVTLTLAVLDTRTGIAALASAGGPPPLLVRADGGAETFTEASGDGNPPLGIRPGVSYAETPVTLGAGDTLLLTSGLAGTGRLAEIAAAHHADAPGRMVEAVLDGVRAEGDDASAGPGGVLAGDVCLLLARRE